MVTGTHAAHLYRKRNKIDFRGNTLRQQADCAVAFTCHVIECPSIPAKLGFFDQYFTDPPVEIPSLTQTLWWEFTEIDHIYNIYV